MTATKLVGSLLFILTYNNVLLVGWYLRLRYGMLQGRKRFSYVWKKMKICTNR